MNRGDDAWADLAATPALAATDGLVDAVARELPSWLLSTPVRVVAAALVVLASAYLSKYVVRLLGRPVARQFERESLAQMVLRLVRLGTIVTGFFVSLSVAGLQVGNVLLSVTVFSAVLGIVLAPIVGSVINGLFVLADQPYEIGDMVELDGTTRGFVDEITIRYTKMFTLDNTFLVIPNSEIRTRDVVNYSAEDERIRLSLQLLVTYESDIAEARQILERAGRRVDMVIEGGPDIRIGSARYPAKPTAYVDEYADHGVLLTLRYWAKKPYKLLTVRSRVNEQVWDLLAEADDVEVAYPHQHLYFDDTSGRLQVDLAAAADRSPGSVPVDPAGADGATGDARAPDGTGSDGGPT
jgi:small-conductance mechanosensitive channel